MRVLGIETSTFTGGVACVEDGVVVAESLLDVRQAHTAVLLPTLDRVLGDAGWTIDDVDGFGVSLGPGSFTSLRIGLATVKGLAAKHDRPVVGVGTLRAMAAGIAAADALLMPVIDARQQEYYTARFRRRRDLLDEESGPTVGPIEELFAEIHEPVCCPGEVDAPLRARIAAATGHAVIVPEPRLPGARPSVIAHLAATALAADEPRPTAALTPIYLRDHLGRTPVA